MVVEVFNCAAKITGGKMAVILGTAVAITAFSACIAPLLHCPDDDDDNDFEESKKTLARTAGIIPKPQSLMTIFLNGLRKIGVISPSTDTEKSPPPSSRKNPTKGKALFTCVPPVVPVVQVSTTPRDPPKNVQEPVHNSLVPPVNDSDKRNVMQCVNIHLILSRSTQSTQTEDDYLSAMETTGTSQGPQIPEGIHESSAVEPRSSDVGTQADTLMTEDRSTLPVQRTSSIATQVRLLMPEARSTLSAPKSSSVGTQARLLMTEDKSTLAPLRSSVQSGPLMTEDRLTLPHPRLLQQAESVTTDESTTSSAVRNPSSSAADTEGSRTDPQVPLKILVPQVPKPPRAHPPQKFITEALGHRDASLRIATEMQTKSSLNQTSSDGSSRLQMRPTPTGRFRAQSSHQYHSSTSFSSSSMEPPSATLYPRHLPGSNPSRSRRSGESKKTLSDSSASLTDRIKSTLKSLQTSKSRSNGIDSKDRPDTTGGQTHASDDWRRSRRLYLAEASRPSSVIQDLERSSEPYSTSEVMSSTRVPNVSMISVAEEIGNDPPGFPDDISHEADHNQEEEVVRRWNRDINHLIRTQNAFLGRNGHHLLPSDHQEATNECPELSPSRPPEILLCCHRPDSRTTISDAETDQPFLRKERRGITERVRNFFLRRGRRKYRRTFPECDTTFEGTLRWNLRPQQCSSL
ncbi:ankyrin-2 [Diachasma alloeum]|uniref:ankyrin-2 n=1 Tax=Diachasma alloeum TaxID=454923 RepID=UPI000738133F|nr:ankyrin-2 [Diachasma alloeum]